MKTLEKNRYRYKRSKNPFKQTWNGVPATKRPSVGDGSLYESFFASILCHIAGLLIIWLITFLVLFFGLTPKLFPTPQPKVKDIEFTLADQPRHRIKHHKIKAKQSTVDRDKAATPEPKKVTEPSPEPKVDFKKLFSPKINPPKPKNNISNTNKNVASKATLGHVKKTNTKGSSHSKSEVPAFPMSMQNLKSMQTGLGGSGRTKHQAAGFDTSSASSLGGFDSSSTGKGSSGHSGFDKNTTRKMITSYDISPYVNELRRNIRFNWRAPKTNGNKRVELFLRIAKDGRIVILNVKRTSEVGDVDNAALNAVKKCVPLSPLPSKYTKSYLDVVFTFDASSVGSRY